MHARARDAHTHKKNIHTYTHVYRRAQNEPSNPSIFGQMLSFEIFTQSESIGSTTSVVKFSYSNSF